MKQSTRSLFLTTIPLVTLGWIASINTAKAQITPDNSLGNESSVVTPDVEIKGVPSDRIDGGAVRGTNLFHSFQQFNVGEARGAYFRNPPGIENILSRVTGNNPSNILGTLGVLGNANLFFINPNGIVFGPNARLDVSGSFLASTANSLVFDNNFEFSATNPQAPPLLSVNIPNGLRFRDNPEKILVQGNGQGVRLNDDLIDTVDALRVESDKTLALVGGNLSLEGATLKTAGGRIELGSVAGVGLVRLNPINKGLSLDYGGVQNFGNIQLSQQTTVDASGKGGGDVHVTGRQITLTNGSQIEASTLESEPGGSLVVNASDSVDLIGVSPFSLVPSALVTFVYSGATSRGGDITLNTERLSIRDGAGMFTGTQGEGNAGNLFINVSSLSVTNRSLIDSSTYAKGAGGDITINTTGLLSIRDGAGVFTDTFGEGNAGNLFINVGSLSVTNRSVISASTSGKGNAGNLFINVGSLSVTNRSVISASTFGEGNAGNLSIKASELVEVLGTEEPNTNPSLRANVEREATGSGGNLTIDTKKLVIRNAQVGASTFGKGDAGNLTVNASESVEITGKVFGINPEPGKPPIRNPAGLFSQVNTQGEGKGGDLTVNTPRLSIGDGGKVQVAVFGKGDAGDLLIRASDIDIYDTPGKADFFEGGIFAGFQVDEDETTAPPKGDFGGTVTIETDRLRVRDGGTVTVFTEGDGNAGTLRITAKDSIEVFGEVVGKTTNRKFTSSISARATADSTGNGGTLILNTDKLIVRDRGQITVSSENNKLAGNLEITARTINLNNQGVITATSRGGDGGNITLNFRDYLFMRRNSEISTSAGTRETDGGNGGNIFINNLPGYRGFAIATPDENNDITANAFRGQGGQVVINSNGIFGFVPRSRQELEKLRPDDLDPRQILTNDISAISQQNPSLSGTVTLNTPEVDTNRELVKLPENVVDPTQLIAQNPCQQVARSEFIVTGRGGLPLNPNQTISSDNVRIDLVKPVANTRSFKSTIQNQQSMSSTVKQIEPARGWVFNEKGLVVLTAFDSSSTGFQRSWQTPTACPAL
ncbi:filamentous hemagglutinin N-terminal domain-containing protein [Scytonema sp. UIC 10036]|uniref:beta strand repeat-containing protein n=1 Tax=Scytonema sp. UIC 10036 TaxID=2304196 RepID=UPI0012DAC73F|nr:S-layer family protein [Scytonema sp. UIC 10036]MUG92409.1 filamentous hemagglutinin N-terminal domain-containing protein [Scytonema sp. UIC 10036]